MSTGADGTINIDLVLNKEKFTPDLESAKNLIQNFGSNAGDEMDNSFGENSSKVLNKAKETHEKIKSDLGDKVTQKIDADGKQAKEAIKNVKDKEEALKKPVTVRIKSNFSEFKHNVGSAMDKIRELRNQSVKVKGAFGGAFGGAFLGNLASNAWGAITNRINEAKDAVVEYNDKQQVMNATWKTLTGSAKDGRAMVDMVNDMSTSLGQDVDVTDELAQQFYHVYDNEPQTKKLTKSFLTMGDAIGLSGDRLKQVGLDFTHTMSSGIMQLGDFNQMTDAFPMYGKALLDYEKKLQHNSNLTMTQLRKQMSDGKISAKDAATVFNNLGEKYKDSAENLMQTLPGMTRKLKTQIPKLVNDMVSPILKARNPIVAQVSKWSSDPKTQSEFKKLGTKVSGAMTDVSKQFSKSLGSGNISSFLDKGIEKFGDFIANSLHWLADHADSIVKIFKSLGSISKNLTIGYINTLGSVFKIFGASGDGITAVANGMEKIAKHKKDVQIIGGVLATMWATSKIDRYIGRVGALIDALKDVSGAVGGLFGKAGVKSTATKAIGAEKSAPIIPMGKKAGSATNLPTAVGKAGKGSKMLAIGKSIGSKLATGAMFAFNAVDIFQGLTAKSKSKHFEKTGRGIGGILGGGIGLAFGGPVGAMIGETIGSLAGQWAGKGAKKFSDGWEAWNKKNKPKGFIAKVGFDTHQAMHNWNNKIAEIEKKHPKVAVAIRFTKGIMTSLGALFKVLGRAIKNGFSDAGDIAKDVFMGKFKKIVPDIKKNFKKMVRGLKDDWNKIVNAFTNNNKKEKNPTKKSSKKRKSSSKRNQGAITEKTIKKVATERKVSSRDVANVKAMAKAIGTYDRAIKTLKKDVKHFPSLKIGNSSKKIKKQIASIKKYDGQIKKSERTMKKYSKTFSSIKKSLKSITRQFTLLKKFNKSFGKKDAFSKLNSDLKNLHKTLKKNDIVKDFKKLNTGLKKNNPSKVIGKINRKIKKSVSIWKKFAKQVKIVNSAFKTLNTFGSIMSKTDPFKKLNTDLKRLSRTLKKHSFGKRLQREVKEANDATRGAKFANEFGSQVTRIIRELNSFRKAFIRDWDNVWAKAESKEKSKTSRLAPTFSNETNKILSAESKFSGKFLNNWSSWLNSTVKSFKSAFNSLPGIASKEMSKVIDKINKGIGSVNSVIGAFGGKKLELAKYATGTSGTGGGLAVVGEQGYELAYDKQHGIYPVGTKGEEVRYLDRNTSIMPHNMSTQFMSMVAGLPHHANGKGDAKGDMMDYLITHLDKIKKNPMPLLTKKFNEKAKFSGSQFERKFGPALENGFLKAISEPFKKELSDMDFSMGGNYDPKMIKATATMMKVNPSDSFIKMLQSVIQSESGGRNVIQQIHDRNSGGNEARGILQYTPQTFGYYAVPGHKNVMNPFDQLLAFFNNSDWQNSIGPTVIWGVPKIDWLHSGPQGTPRFANGGWSDRPSIFGEAGEPEVAINPNRDSADALIMQAIQKRIEKNPNGTLARTIRTIHNSRNQAHEFSGKSIANNNASVASGNVGVNSKTLGNITVNTLLDNGVIVQGTYPLIKAMQAKEINLQAKKGGLH